MYRVNVCVSVKCEQSNEIYIFFIVKTQKIASTASNWDRPLPRKEPHVPTRTPSNDKNTN